MVDLDIARFQHDVDGAGLVDVDRALGSEHAVHMVPTTQGVGAGAVRNRESRARSHCPRSRHRRPPTASPPSSARAASRRRPDATAPVVRLRRLADVVRREEGDIGTRRTPRPGRRGGRRATMPSQNGSSATRSWPRSSPRTFGVTCLPASRRGHPSRATVSAASTHATPHDEPSRSMFVAVPSGVSGGLTAINSTSRQFALTESNRRPSLGFL